MSEITRDETPTRVLGGTGKTGRRVDGDGRVGLVLEGPWVAANIVRTLVCTAAVAALARALVLHGRGTAGPTARASTGGSP